MITFSDGSQTVDISVYARFVVDNADDYLTDVLDPAGYPWDPDKEAYMCADLGLVIQRCFEWKYGRGAYAGKDPKEGQPGHCARDRFVIVTDVTHGRD